MSPPDGSTTLTLNDTEADESKIRAALGLASGRVQLKLLAERSRHKANSSNVPPVIVSARRSHEVSDSLRARLASLMEELKAERGERVAAQQALADAQRFIQQLQTKLAHTEMAAAEALEAEQKIRLAAEAEFLATPSASALKPKTEKPAEPKKRGRPFKQPFVVEQAEPEPVQWWLPSYKASKPKRARSTS